jgi:hypothetical protein
MPVTVVIVALCVALLLPCVSVEARDLYRRGGGAIIRAERRDHAISGPLAMVAAGAAILIVLRVLVAWAFSSISFG